MLYPRTRTARAALVTGLIALFGSAMLSGCNSKDQAGQVTGSYEVASDDSSDTRGAPASSQPGSRAPASVKTSRGAGNQSASKAAPIKPPTMAAAQLSNYELPQGGPAELLKFIEDLDQQTPAGATQAEMLADLEKMQRARIKAADRILAASSVEKENREAAVHAKLNSLRVLAEIGQPVEQDIREFCETLRQDENPDLARLGRVILFGIQLGEAVDQQNATQQTADFQPIMAELKALLQEEGPYEEVFQVSRQAALAMDAAGNGEMAAEAYKLVGKTFENSSNPQLAEVALMMLDRAKIVASDFDRKLDAALTDQPNVMPPLIDAARELLSEKDPGALILQSTSRAAQILEYTQNYDPAKELFAMIEQAYANHSDQELAQQAQQMVEYGKRRVALIGQPFTIEGRLLNGATFDWSQYQGKVVLVDFWATWCGPCIGEIPNIKENYEKYHDKGFEVVGINLDDSDEAVERFLAMENLPWPTVRSADPQEDGMANPLAVESGVDAIPFVVLVNRQGNVENLHVRGELLGQELERLLGSPAADQAGSQASRQSGQARTAAAGAATERR